MSHPESAGAAATTGWRPQAVVLLAPVLVAGMAALLWYFAGVTFHGPDQIRDMAIARAMVHDGVWPLTGPPLFGGNVFLPPAYYWLLALPLLLHDSEITVFVAFGTAFALSVGYVWQRVRQALGPDVALLYVLLAFPVFATSYTHSAWNPALTMTFSNLLLGLFIAAVAQRRRGWLLLPWVFALLLQVHASAAPLAAGLLVYVLCHARVLVHPRTLASVAALVLALVLWIALAGWPINLLPGRPGGGSVAAVVASWWAHLTRLAAWRDLALLPWNAVRSIHPALGVATPVAGAQQALLLGGLVCAVAVIFRNRICGWLALVAGLWLLLAVAFLEIGLFWYADVIYPWLAVLAAAGWAHVLQRLRTPRGALAGVGAALFAGLFAGHVDFYSSWQRSGKLTMRAALLEFPQVAAPESELPGYSFDYLQQVRQILQESSICAAQLAGVEATVMRDITSRRFEPDCAGGPPGAARKRAYLMLRPRDEAGFMFAHGLVAKWQVGSTRIYQPPYVPVAINGRQRARLEGRDAAAGFGFGYPPRQLPAGVRLDIAAPGQKLVLRVGLRCDAGQALRPDQWTVRHAAELAPPRLAKRWQFAWTYYDVEWQLQAQAGAESVQVVSDARPLYCDVTAIARIRDDL